MKGFIDTRIVPEKLVVGIREADRMCYVTYYETKGSKTNLNSQHSWSSWSENDKDPIIVDNQFATGFALQGVNGRWSRQARNSDNLVITHPLFEYGFELNLSRFLELIEDCVIDNGVIQKEFIMDYQRDIITREEYEERIEERDAKDLADAKKVAKLNASKLSKSDQKVGHVYRDAKSGKEFIFLGTIGFQEYEVKYTETSQRARWNSIELYKPEVKKFIYMELGKDGETSHYEVKAEYWGSREDGTSEHKVAGTFQSPLIVSTYGGVINHNPDDVYFRSTAYARDYSIVKNQKSMSVSENKLDYFKDYSEEDWKLIDEAFNYKFHSQCGMSTYDIWAGKGIVENNFRTEYEAQGNE